MSGIIRRHARARVDLIDLAAYMGADSPSSAARFLDAAERTFAALAQMPEMGETFLSDHPRLQGLRKFRISGFGNYLLFYRPIRGGIEVVRVIHGARDLPSVLEEEADTDI